MLEIVTSPAGKFNAATGPLSTEWCNACGPCLAPSTEMEWRKCFAHWMRQAGRLQFWAGYPGEGPEPSGCITSLMWEDYLDEPGRREWWCRWQV